MASEMGISRSSVQRIWKAFGLQPHRVKTFKLSTDPQFVEKVRVGLYMSPPENAVGAVRRREEPMPGAGSHAAAVAHDARAGRAAHARL